MQRDTTRLLLEWLNRDAERIARHFDLQYRSIAAERPSVRSRYGVCFSDGVIRVRLRHATSGRPLKYSSLIDTLCHELAHLRHFDHGMRFKVLYGELLAWARGEGIYRPDEAAVRGPSAARVPRRGAASAPPVQLGLFADDRLRSSGRAGRTPRGCSGPRPPWR